MDSASSQWPASSAACAASRTSVIGAMSVIMGLPECQGRQYDGPDAASGLDRFAQLVDCITALSGRSNPNEPGERAEHLRVENGAGFLLHDLERLLAGVGTAETARTGQRVVDIGNADNARSQWDLLTLETIGISSSIPVFVVVADHRPDIFRELQPLDQ